MQDSVQDYFMKRRMWNAQYLQELKDGHHPHQPQPERVFDGLQFVQAPTHCWLTSVEGSYLAPQHHTAGRVVQARISMFERVFSLDLASKLIAEGTHRLATAAEVSQELADQQARKAGYASADAQLGNRNQGNVVVIPRVNQ